MPQVDMENMNNMNSIMKILFHTVSWKKSQTNTWNVYNNPVIVTVSSPYQHISTAYPDPSTVAPSVSLSEPSGLGEEAKELFLQGFVFRGRAVIFLEDL